MRKKPTLPPVPAAATVDADLIPAGYGLWLAELKTRISEARGRAAVAVNRELVLLYWNIGREILGRQHEQGWGARVVEQLANDLRHAFPEMKGLSLRNLRYMRAFAEAFSDGEVVQRVVAQLPWGHVTELLGRLRTKGDRDWYARKAVEHRWTRPVLVHQIDSRLVDRSGEAVTNFARTLPEPDAAVAQQLTKDPHVFDFLGLGEEAAERDLEDALVGQIQRVMMELGRGFAFIGRQFHLEVGGDDYYIDLLFYNYLLHRFIAVELKVDAFKPEYAGKLGFYLAALDGQVKSDHDGPSIGLLLCRSKNKVVVEYALRDMSKPMGVSEYRLLPASLRNVLPSIEALETAATLSGAITASATASGVLSVGSAERESDRH